MALAQEEAAVGVITEERVDNQEFWSMVSDIGGTPPCELEMEHSAEKCGKPSVIRVIVICRCSEEPLFLCRECFEDMINGYSSCTSCGWQVLQWRKA
jgi:hypothetical protein